MQGAGPAFFICAGSRAGRAGSAVGRCRLGGVLQGELHGTAAEPPEGPAHGGSGAYPPDSGASESVNLPWAFGETRRLHLERPPRVDVREVFRTDGDRGLKPSSTLAGVSRAPDAVKERGRREVTDLRNGSPEKRLSNGLSGNVSYGQ